MLWHFFKTSFPIYFVAVFAFSSVNAPVLAQDSLRRETDSIAQIIPDTLLFKIQKAQSTITEINAANKKGYEVDAINERVSNIQASISSVKKDFDTGKGNLETRNLLSYKLILKDVSTEINAISVRLMKYNSELQRMSQQIVDLSADSLLSVSGNDEQKLLYAAQLNQIKTKLQQAGKNTGKGLEAVSALLAKASAITITINDLQATLEEQFSKSSQLAVNREVSYLWSAPFHSGSFNDLGTRLSDSFEGQREILQYFINSTWDVRILVFLIMGGFYFWVHRNFKSSQRLSVKRKIGELNFDYLRPNPILATLIVMLCITPFFQPDAPSIYVEILQLLMLLIMSIHLRKVLTKQALGFWLMILGSYCLMIIFASVINESLLLRLFLLFINVAFIYLGIQLYRKVKVLQFPKRFFKMVVIVVVVFHALGIIFNLFGRISLSKSFTMAGIISLTQVLGLAVFVQIFLDAMELQIKISSCNKGLFSRINPQKLKTKLKKLLTFLSFILWITVIMINLSITGGVGKIVSDILYKERIFGSIHFSLGNVLFFIVIIYLSNKLQKHVPILFGEERVSFDGASSHKGSKVALFRLIIIIAGLLLAFTASGLPMDKLTVVLGALGVGIGLGMQNIVNNFVSGIILIFEKPFRIGDYVELADKKGKVQDIGIRSSKLLTPQGSEVIIPNGDLLSGRLVNWTLSNDYLKSELLIKISSAAAIETVQETINEVIKSSDHTVSNLSPEILINNIAADSMEIKILVWIDNVYIEAAFKSDVLLKLMKAFQLKEIKVM